ncbi:3610_t:CDS:2 [Funneliformis mosseae]|uniref:3610_t:CDS:1 n=1 Tax=Funneliformis mosseae TaxID=27381 RepID=A0A9N8W488_FUNMO|nr:3610_t:CDS:2 [Funneliformis mosseae]
MLPGWLHEKTFSDNSSNVPVQAEVVEIALKHLNIKRTSNEIRRIKSLKYAIKPGWTRFETIMVLLHVLLATRKLVESERKFTDEKVKKIVKFKKQVCGDTNKGFVVISQKGIDPLSLDLLCKNGILALRRVKRRNMERLKLICGGVAQNSVDDLSPEVLGYAGLIYVFLEKKNIPLLKRLKIQNLLRYWLKDLILTQLRKLMMPLKINSRGGQDGSSSICNAMLIIPKVLSQNGGFNAQDTIVALQEEFSAEYIIGIRETYMTLLWKGIWDNYHIGPDKILTVKIDGQETRWFN